MTGVFILRESEREREINGEDKVTKTFSLCTCSWESIVDMLQYVLQIPACIVADDNICRGDNICCHRLHEIIDLRLWNSRHDVLCK